jgi:putative glutamine amidotransferase
MRPRIGITAWHRMDADGLERWEAIRDTYTGAVHLAGGLPIILPVGEADPEAVADYLTAVDGLLFSGGEDIAPAYYGEARDERCGEPDPERDLFEIQLGRGALECRLPVLGVCRGLQVLNVAAGGSLYQDVACRPGTLAAHSASFSERGRLIHAVRILPDTRLCGVMGVAESRVTSTHHQFVRTVAPGFRVAAESLEDGIVEGIERTGDHFLLAVQWHPERMVRDHPPHLALFRALVEAARGGRGA